MQTSKSLSPPHRRPRSQSPQSMLDITYQSHPSGVARTSGEVEVGESTDLGESIATDEDGFAVVRAKRRE